MRAAAFGRIRRVTLAATFAAMSTGLLGSSCRGGLEDYVATEINEQRYPVEANASAECLSAAKRATRYCLGRKSMMDVESQADCNDARWDYHRYCR